MPKKHLAANDAAWAEHALLAPCARNRRDEIRLVGPGASAPAHAAAAACGRVARCAVPLDAGLLGRFARQHDLRALHVVASPDQAGGDQVLRLSDTITLAWQDYDPIAGMHRRLPYILACAASVFVLLVWSILRQSTTIASDLIASEARARHLAFHDTLTGLPNRAMMFDRLGQMLAMARRYYAETAVHCLDLDRFKEVNDLLGHHAGDELIQQVAQRVTELCRDSGGGGWAATNS
jgi:GAF domain-containing protein